LNAPFILASASPRRKSLLAQIGVEPAEIVATNIDESVRPSETPGPHAARLAREKAEAAPAKPGLAVLAADTVVACGRRILPKAEDPGVAGACLRLMSGRAHRVYTGVALRLADGRLIERLVETRVRVKRLSELEIADYLATDEWRGKAGGYAIQGRFEAYVLGIVGSYSNIVGLPLYETAGLLKGAGLIK
jgi:septum formation protein